MTTRDEAIKCLKEAKKLLMRLLEDEGGRGVELAEAIDHTATALTCLGEEE